MASNSFGNLFKITTFGESHGKALGVVIDGCPSKLPLKEEDIQKELFFRRPGRPFTSERKELDVVEILSGVFEGRTTGAPICLLIRNVDVDESSYNRELLRPGHANFTYLKKYGLFDYRGGGRASGRETVCRVAAGAIAKKILAHFDISLVAYLKEAGGIAIKEALDFRELKTKVLESPIFCPEKETEALILEEMKKISKAGDSIGGIVELISSSLPIGLGDPIYEKLSSNLAKAMFSIGGVKGFEIGEGFSSSRMHGSMHNDLFDGQIKMKTNHAGGLLGGITTGMPLVLRVAFKPTPSIARPQETIDLQGNKKILEGRGRHDPCIAIRAVPVVEAMAGLVLVDALLMNRAMKL